MERKREREREMERERDTEEETDGRRQGECLLEEKHSGVIRRTLDSRGVSFGQIFTHCVVLSLTLHQQQFLVCVCVHARTCIRVCAYMCVCVCVCVCVCL